MSPTVLIAVLVSGLLAIAAWARLAELHRASAIGRVAVARGWRYEPYASRFVMNGPGALSLFKHGGGVARNLVTDGPIALFDHVARAEGRPATSEGSSMAVGAARVGGLCAFRLEFKRPGTFGLTSSVYASADELELDERSGFGDTYRLFGEDAAAVRALFTDRVVAFFAANPGWCVETDGRWLIAYGALGHLEPQRLAAQVDAFRRVVAQFS